MGAAKNIFGVFGKIADKAKDVVKPIFKSADSRVIKTTSKTLGNAAPAISGGRSVVKQSATNFAKGVGSTAKVGGKVFGVTGILGGVALGGAKIYDYVGDTWAVTTAQREYENQIKLAGDEADVTKQAMDNQLDYMNKVNDLRNSGDSAGMGASGGAGSNLFPIGQGVAAAQGSGNIMWYALIALAVVGSGTYIYSKSRGKK